MLRYRVLWVALSAHILLFSLTFSTAWAQTTSLIPVPTAAPQNMRAGLIEQQMLAQQKSANDLSFPPPDAPKKQAAQVAPVQFRQNLGPNLQPPAAAPVIATAAPATAPLRINPVAAAAPQATPKYVALASPGAQSTRPMPAINPKFMRQEVDYESREPVGTVIVDTQEHFLYLILTQGRAMRYGIGVGRAGFEWKGVEKISRKAEWPEWIPPKEMLLRRPDLPVRLAGGPNNPLGARALYLGATLYRIHGTNEPWTIGMSMSSGCIRMMNDDVVDLYDRVPVGTRVIVK